MCLRFFSATKQDEITQHGFSYNTGNVVREESRDVDGVTRGFYDYLDPNGIIQHVEYIADSKGFRVRATNLPLHVVEKQTQENHNESVLVK
ncbi:cuticle protein 6-like [Tribolium madens]|uniref:cuticle protein 6-like n=1 Tax=Tribolium madens TaxID=41895 RepID=UPI001CF7475D|nr:cuticle protein 6-like [Tribolium madens]